ncbi:hypothetical protein CCZ37_07450 [Vibrio qinghaiensis]|uniref:OmpR/PhoB-type domain-containing protein n=1 Tax=Vibrio qinghaiensis TaxID=2025808 RepID=A0A223MY05_9VIBR|nr:winged helix-turn-helix domain-containing protein [Vibrio qinghaiensis]ASU22435.1 hypothetical protein CCZ37_07450 [Vibrio qinghaiensis]
MSERFYFLGEGIIFDSLKREIVIDNDRLRLGGRESEILKLLCDNPNKIITKEDIHIKVWGSIYVSGTSLTKAISNLRKLLSTISTLACEIKTIPKEGYTLISDNLSAMKMPAYLATDVIQEDYSSEEVTFHQNSTEATSDIFLQKSMLYSILLVSVISSSITFFINILWL